METKHVANGDAQPPLVRGSVRLYGMRFCPYDQRVRLVLDAKNIAYDAVNIKLSSKPDWFFNKGTNGKIPVLELEDGTTLAESLIIADYLDAAYPQPALYPNDPLAKALDRLVLAKYEPMASNFYKFLTESGFTTENFNLLLDTFLSLEEELVKRNTKFFCGSKPGMLDLMMLPWIERAPMLGKMGGPKFELPKEKLSKLLKWRSDMLEVPSVKKSALPVDVHTTFLTIGRGPGFFDFNYDMLVK